MKFLCRCKHIYLILKISCIFLGLYVGFHVYNYLLVEKVNWTGIADLNFTIILHMIIFFFWVLLVTITIILKYIIKDVEEDLVAIKRINENNIL